MIQGGVALASGEAGAFVSDKVSTLDVNSWLKATAGPVAGVATFGVANAATTRYIVPSIKSANAIGSVESNRSITEIAKTDTMNIKKVSRSGIKNEQLHHYATNKNLTYTPQFEEIANKYGLKLDDEWNKGYMPHQGRHPNDYHQYVLDNMRTFDNIAQGDKEVLIRVLID